MPILLTLTTIMLLICLSDSANIFLAMSKQIFESGSDKIPFKHCKHPKSLSHEFSPHLMCLDTICQLKPDSSGPYVSLVRRKSEKKMMKSPCVYIPLLIYAYRKMSMLMRIVLMEVVAEEHTYHYSE